MASTSTRAQLLSHNSQPFVIFNNPAQQLSNSTPMQFVNLLAMLWILSMSFTLSTLFAECGRGKKKIKKGKQPPKKGGKQAANKGGKQKAPSPKKGKQGKNKQRKGGEPKFGAIKSDHLQSYEDANKQLRRPKSRPSSDQPPDLEPTPAPPPIGDGPKLVEQKPDDQVGTGDTPEYDTLNFVKKLDVFGGGDNNKNADVDEPADGPKLVEQKPADQVGTGDTPEYDTLNFVRQKDVFGDNKKDTPEANDEQGGDDNNDDEEEPEEGANQQGMGGGGDYETLADIQKGDIFGKK